MQGVLSTFKSPNPFASFRSGLERCAPIRAAVIGIALFAIASLAGCGISYNALPLTASPGSLSFGSVTVGKAQTAAITLSNSGLKSVTLSGVQSADAAFSVAASQSQVTVPAGGSINIQVTFTPTEVKSYSSQLTVQSGSRQTTVPVFGEGQQGKTTTPPPVRPALQVSATALQFGSVPIGGNSQQSLTLTSSGTAALQINTLGITGVGFSEQAPSLPLTLQPGQVLTLPVKFVPAASGAANGNLTIASNAALTPSVTVSLAGSGASSNPVPPPQNTPALTLSNTAVDFGSVALGSSGSNSVTLTSSGTASVVVQAIAVSGADFSAGQLPLPLTLAPGQQVVLPLTFTPTSAGAEQGNITLTDNAAGSPNAIALSGTGVAASAAALSAPGSVDFGDITVGTHGSKTITLVSTGTAPLTISSIDVTGAAFSNAPNALPQVLQPNQQMSVKLKFSPTSAGDTTGSLTINSNAAGNSKTTIHIHGKGVGANTPSLSASASSFSFGSVQVGSTAGKVLTVTSTGTAPATITAGSINGAFTTTLAGVPVQNLSSPIVLQPGQQVAFNVGFSPTVSGTANGQLSLATDTGSPLNVSLSGNGIQATSPALSLSAPSLDFGGVQVGSTSNLQLTLNSSGTAPVTISSSAVAGQGFQIASVAWPSGVNSWPVTLNPGQQLVLTVAFTPDAVNSFSGNLALVSDASGGTANVPLSGTGDAVPVANLTISPASIDFGQTPVGTKVTRQVTVTSGGSAALNINTIDVSGAQFTVAPQSLPLVLQPGQQASLTLTYEPTAVGNDAGLLTIGSNDPSGPATVSLGGSGTATTTPQLRVNPTSVAFGSVPLNTAATSSVTLTSTGSAAVTISAATVAGTDFSISGASFPLTLNPNQSATLQVQFKPTQTGAESSQLTLTSNSSTGATIQVALSGTGTAATTPQLTLSSTSLAFGNVAVNSSATLPVTLTSSGTAPVTISSASLSGAAFTDSGVSFPVTLNPNQAVTLNVQFNPKATGSAAGQLTITSNSVSNPTAQIQLSGTGTSVSNPQLLVSATSLAFGNVAVGSTATLNLVLTSSGTAPLTISSVAAQGSAFSDSGASFPVTLNPNQSVTLQVQFDPSAAGNVTGQLTIASNSSSGSTTLVTLSGTGAAVQHEIDLSWNAPSSSSDPVAGYNVYRSSNGGSSFIKINSSPNAGVTYTDSTVQSGTTYVYEVKSVDGSGVESTPSNQITLAVP